MGVDGGGGGRAVVLWAGMIAKLVKRWTHRRKGTGFDPRL
jgi:hypothetical protein